jgi:cysteine dioxygenase
MHSIKLLTSDLENYCSWSNKSYTRNCIIDNEKFELILLCWAPGQITPIHDHGGEECWVKFITGEFKEIIYQENDLGDLAIVKSGISKAGDISYMIDFMGCHTLENLSKKRSMSLHLYAKPIRTCNVYDKGSRKFVSKNLAYCTVPQSANKL